MGVLLLEELDELLLEEFELLLLEELDELLLGTTRTRLIPL